MGLRFDQLPLAVPPSITDIIPVMQGGVTRQNSVSQASAALTYTASGIVRPLSAKLGDIISVKDFGATGGGITDDTAAIQTAITLSPGKSIFFPNGVYLISNPLTITADNTRIVGTGIGSIVKNTSITGHCFKFDPNNTATTTTFINNCGIENLLITSAADKTTGAGVYALQCNGFRLHNVQIQNHPEGLVVSGGQLNVFDKLTVFASESVLTGTPVSNSQALRFCEAPITGGLYQDCYTCEVSNLIVGGRRALDKGIRIESADGLHFTNGYINGAYSDEVYVKVLTASRYVAGVVFSSFYFDGIGYTTAPAGRNGVSIPSSALGTVYSLTFSNCQIGNYTGEGCSVTDGVNRLTFIGTEFINIDSWAVDVAGDNTATQLTVSGCNLQNVGAVTINKGGISASAVLEAVITGNTFKGINNTGASAIATAGTNAHGNIDGNTFSNCTTNIADTATWTGNISGIPIAWTPALTFATPGDLAVTYSSQTGRFIRKGSMCSVLFSIQTSAFTYGGTASGALTITGLPVASSSATQIGAGGLAFGGITKANYTNYTLRKPASGTTLTIEASGSGQALSSVTSADTGSGTNVTIHGSMTYEALP